MTSRTTVRTWLGRTLAGSLLIVAAACGWNPYTVCGFVADFSVVSRINYQAEPWSALREAQAFYGSDFFCTAVHNGAVASYPVDYVDPSSQSTAQMARDEWGVKFSL